MEFLSGDASPLLTSTAAPTNLARTTEVEFETWVFLEFLRDRLQMRIGYMHGALIQVMSFDSQDQLSDAIMST